MSITFMTSDVERVKEVLDIADVVGGYIQLRKAGSHYKALCPFHNENTPSFIVSPDRGTYHCFGCGASGDVLSFVQEFEGLDFKGALELLARSAGVELQKGGGQNSAERDRLLAVLDEAASFFEEQLGSKKEVQRYIHDRGVTDRSVQEWRVGYAPNEWRSLREHLEQKGWRYDDMSKAGLVKSKNGHVFDTFRNRIVFPIFDPSGRVIAFSGRLFGDDADAPKYLNSPDTPIFNKSEVLYGLHVAGPAIRKAGYAIIVEGQFDIVLSHQAGVRNTIASSGTAITTDHIHRIKRFTQSIILAFDPDDSGVRAAYKTAVLALKEGVDVKVARLPHGKDPADCLCEDPAIWKTVLTEASHVIEHSLQRALDTGRDRRQQFKVMRETTFSFLGLLSSEMERSYFIGLIADRLNIPAADVRADAERAMEEDMNRSTSTEQRPDVVKRSSATPDRPRTDRVTRLLAALISWIEKGSEPLHIQK